MGLNEDFITVDSGEYDTLTTDNDGTRNDKINKPLLDDLDAVGKKTGIKIKITTARSGHPTNTINGNRSRHSTNQAVDIAILNGIGANGATNASNGNPQFRELGDRVCAELEKMGYTRNSEGGNKKAVLWQTNTGGNHFNHLHVSNTTDTPSQPPSEENGETKSGDTKNKKHTLVPSNTEEPDEDRPSIEKVFSWADQELKPFISAYNKTKSDIKKEGFGKMFSNENINELEIKKGPFTASNPSEDIIWDIETDNSFPTRVVGNISNCEGSLTLAFQKEGQKYYVEFCGLEKIRKRRGDIIQTGDALGNSSDRTIGTFFDQYSNPLSFDTTPKNDSPEVSKNQQYDDQYQPQKYALFRDEEGNIPNTSLGQFSQLLANLNPLASRYAIDDKTGKPVKVQQGIFGSTASDSSTNPKRMNYLDKIKLARTKAAAEKKGLKVVDTRPELKGKKNKFLKPEYMLKSKYDKNPPKSKSGKLKEEIENIKKLIK